jgi:hypothetical protein
VDSKFDLTNDEVAHLAYISVSLVVYLGLTAFF